MNPLILYLHIPHTAGREIRKHLSSFGVTDKYRYVHNSKDIENFLRLCPKNTPVYFVLRNPKDRLIGEFCHYSELLSNAGQVNHLHIKSLKTCIKSFNPTDPYQYFKLEVNINVMCKFILKRTDFSKNITPEDYDNIVDLIKRGDAIYDIFNANQLSMDNLSKKLSVDNNSLSSKINNRDFNKYNKNKNRKEILLQDSELNEYIKNQNEYDFMLYDFLINKIK